VRHELAGEEALRAKSPEARGESAPEPEPAALRIASALGNQAVQRIANSPELQRSAASAGLLSGVGQTIARRQSLEEQEGEGPGQGPEGSSRDPCRREANVRDPGVRSSPAFRSSRFSPRRRTTPSPTPSTRCATSHPTRGSPPRRGRSRSARKWPRIPTRPWTISPVAELAAANGSSRRGRSAVGRRRAHTSVGSSGQIQWTSVPDSSRCIGKALSECAFRAENLETRPPTATTNTRVGVIRAIRVVVELLDENGRSNGQSYGARPSHERQREPHRIVR
jgi:hypothetical protein